MIMKSMRRSFLNQDYITGVPSHSKAMQIKISTTSILKLIDMLSPKREILIQIANNTRIRNQGTRRIIEIKDFKASETI